jgi:hypothetical protein
MFNPTGAIAGELFNARMLTGEGVEEQDALKSVLLARTLMILSQLLLLVAVLVRFMFSLPDELSREMKFTVYIFFPALLLAVSGLAFLLLRKGRETKTRLKRKKLHKIISRIGEMRFLLAAHIRIHPGKTAAAFLLFAAHWILGSLELFFILYFLHYPVDVWDSIFLDTLIIVLKSTATFVPGQLGAEELINRFALHLPGIYPADLWLPVSILRRARQLFWSGMALLFYVRLRNIHATGSDAESHESTNEKNGCIRSIYFSKRGRRKVERTSNGSRRNPSGKSREKTTLHPLHECISKERK